MDIFVFVESLKSSKRSKRLLLISVEKQFLQKWRQFFASNELKQLFDSESVYASDFGLAIWRSNAFSEKNSPPPQKKLCLRQCDYIRIFSKGNGDEFYCQSGLNIRWLFGWLLCDLKKVTIEASKTTFWAILEKVWLLCIQSFGHTACLQKRLTTDGTIYCEIGSRHSLSCCS